MHNGQKKLNLEGVLAVVGFEVTPESVRTGTRPGNWRKRVADFRGCNTKTVGIIRVKCIRSAVYI